MTKHQSVLYLNLFKASEGGKMVVITPHFVQFDGKVAELIFLSNKTLSFSGNVLTFPP